MFQHIFISSISRYILLDQFPKLSDSRTNDRALGSIQYLHYNSHPISLPYYKCNTKQENNSQLRYYIWSICNYTA
jgi:hypothetical protein